MAEESNSSESPDSVFGNLPGTRPGGRSPRRRSNGDSPPPERPRQPAAKRASAPPPPPPEPEPVDPPPGSERDAPVAPDPGAPRIHSVEDLAWAGIALAAEAATVGVRFASRALEAARKASDRDGDH